jgi:hypothetical protein
MPNLSCARIALGLAGTLMLAAAPARAQYEPRPVTTVPLGEDFHIEAGVSTWGPSADMSITSGGTGTLSALAGTTIDAKKDLGFEDQRMPMFNVVARPGGGHKFRFQYIPIDYTAAATLNRTIVFNGQRYSVGLPVNSTLDWKAFRFGYEFDFVRKDWGYVGFITELKYTDVNLEIDSPITSEFTHQRAPIPALGGVGRVYVAKNVAITGELTAFKLPTIEDRYAGHYVDLDIYGTVNFVKNFGVQAGYRTMNLGYLIKEDTGDFVLKGLYFGVVARY